MSGVRAILPFRPRWSTFLFVLLLSSTKAFGFEENKPQLRAFREKLVGLGFTAIPLERTDDKRIYALVTIHGKVTRWLVDSSSAMSRSIPSFVKNLPLAGTNGEPEHDAVLGPLTNHPNPIYIIPQLSIGSLTISNTPVTAFSLHGREQLTGVFGLDFLIRNDCLIECSKPTLYVRNWESATKANRDHEVSDVAKGIYACPMKLTKIGMQVPAIINTYRVLLVVATASWATFLDDSTAARFKIRGEASSTYALGPTQVEKSARKFTAKMLALGFFRIGNADIGIVDLDALNPRSSAEDIDRVAGTLGMEHMMWNFGLIDVCGGHLFLAPTQPR
ncbi:MAG TPA: hypothetical protein VMB21_06305 [Candidatus Limnocylindria bacterium]|jgi:hypothetical protein|nr:hypothetical protein [Candidatus Limnocylindria bacterium]